MLVGNINVFEQVLEEAGLLTENAQAITALLMDEILSVGSTELAAQRGVAYANDWPLPEKYINTPVARTWLDLDDFMSELAGNQAVEMFGKGLMGYQANMGQAILEQIGQQYTGVGNPEFERLLDALVGAVVDANDGELSQHIMGLVEERRLWDTAEALILFDRGVKLHNALLTFQAAMLRLNK